MESNPDKIDRDLMRVLDTLDDDDVVVALVHPERTGKGLETFLMDRKKQGGLDYNILTFANCIALRTSKRVILEIADREDVARVSADPEVSTNSPDRG